MYSFVVYLYVNGSGSITLVGEERANLSAVVYLKLCGFCRRGFLFLWVLGVAYVILLGHSLSLPYNHFGTGDIFENGVHVCTTNSYFDIHLHSVFKTVVHVFICISQ